MKSSPVVECRPSVTQPLPPASESAVARKSCSQEDGSTFASAPLCFPSPPRLPKYHSCSVIELWNWSARSRRPPTRAEGASALSFASSSSTLPRFFTAPA
ncbi:MAG: hypothetical protein Q8L14_27165 [Myxococcales bacterium]|nr:hypothetical protein [Myxococcales bacterium]